MRKDVLALIVRLTPLRLPTRWSNSLTDKTFELFCRLVALLTELMYKESPFALSTVDVELLRKLFAAID